MPAVLLGILNVSAQTTGNKGFKLNVNSKCLSGLRRYHTAQRKAGAQHHRGMVNITLDELADRFIIFKRAT